MNVARVTIGKVEHADVASIDVLHAQDDEPLIQAARAGDLDAFNLLVERYERLIFSVCVRLLRDHELAEDVTQDAFIRAYTALDSYDGRSFRAWLTRIATNRSYDILRYHRRRPLDSLNNQAVEEEPRWTTDAPSDNPDQAATQHELAERLEAALAQLSEEQRVVVLLHDVHGYQYEEIAQIVEVSLGTVKSRLSRARGRLRELLRNDTRSRELFEGQIRHLSSDESG